MAIVKIDNFEEDSYMQLLKKKKINFEELYSENMLVVARRGHPLSLQKAGISDIKNYQTVSDHIDINRYIQAAYGTDYCSEDSQVINNPSGIQKYILNTNAVSVISQYEIKSLDTFFDPDIQILDIQNFNWNRKIGCIWSNRILNEAEKIFIKLLHEKCYQK